MPEQSTNWPDEMKDDHASHIPPVFSASVGVCGDVPLYLPYLVLFGPPKGTVMALPAWSIPGSCCVVSPVVSPVSSQTSLVRLLACPLGSSIFILNCGVSLRSQSISHCLKMFIFGFLFVCVLPMM